MTSESIIIAVELLILSLTIAVIVGIFARQQRVPYTVGLVLIGLFIVLVSPTLRQLEGLPFLGTMLGLLDELILLEDELVREIILGLMVPPLIFEAALHLRFTDVKQNIGAIVLFAIPGVIITTFLVGGVVAWGIGIDFATAAVFGALIAATDPVAVVALFRILGVPRRLRVLLEGESLLNDGTAIVVFGLALAVAGGQTFQLSSSIVDFIIVAGGGLLIGVGLGGVISVVGTRIDDHLIETALTFILAYGAYFIAENAHVSGVLAVVSAGMLHGNFGPKAMSPTTRIVVKNFWEFTAFIANSLVFLLIGLVVDPIILWANKWIILLAILAVLAARGIVVYGFSALVKTIPFRWQLILHWGGLRGAIALALALSLNNDDLRAMAFGVVIFTLLVQGTTMGPIVRRLKLATRSPEQESFQRRKAHAYATREAQKRLETLFKDGIISNHTREIIAPILEEHRGELKQGIRKVLQTKPAVATEELDAAWREVLRVQRATLDELFIEGVITEEHFWELAAPIDSALQVIEITWMDLKELKGGLNLKEVDGE
jgi:CPA1 family monovalent cation:H+ antiporter